MANLCDGVYYTAHREDTFYSALLVVADCALGTGLLADVGNILTALANNGCSFRAGDHSSDVNPGSLVIDIGRRGGRDGSGPSSRGRCNSFAFANVRNNSVALVVFGIGAGSIRVLSRLVRSCGRRSRRRLVAVALGDVDLVVVLVILFIVVVVDDLVERRSLGFRLVVTS